MSITPFSLSLSLLTLAATSLVHAAEETPERWASDGKAAIQAALDRRPIEKQARNVILFVGDGMGISTVTASRIYEGQRRGETGEENWLSFETLPYTALAKTYNVDLQTPDSAGTMSAMVTGIKTNAGVLSVNQYSVRGDADSVAGNEVVTLLEKAEIAGKATGIVTTARVTHATPGACYAHSSNRNWECDANMPEGAPISDIAAQLIEMPARMQAAGFAQVDGPELVWGGGRRFFFPEGEIDAQYSVEGDSGRRKDGRNLVQEWIDTREGGSYIHNLDTFESIDVNADSKILGLFESSHMQFEADREKDAGGEPSLAEMTRKAIALLERDEDGYFLMVEGGRIDHAHHAGNAYRALADTVALSDAVRVAREATSEEDTLIIVTADHSHVFTMAGYPARGNNILGLVANADGKLAEDAMDLPYTTLGYQNGPGYLGASDAQPEGPKVFPHSPTGAKGIREGRHDLSEHLHGELEDGCDAFFSHLQESAYPMSSETHGGEDVGVWASGPYAHLLGGTIEQHVLFHLMEFAFGFSE
ncbi:alkaline phosphatase [Pelagicoccus sp. SDUM812005]|uniref:alkaline phosphatase n=1 Tax=Pelagicoccus sp. SDUM812005 TaxID=3041257 RepID=UPI00281036D1|nr:alkaline phosphatase [Pelagicoccus sp. SDUM812005]MDQ8181343.1 alkaline phosphatase [Pelagicoccus sp. SDUM812005]